MREFLNSNILFTELAMIRQESTVLLLIPEGDDDFFLLRDHLTSNIQLIAGRGGRPGVLEAAHRTAMARLDGVRFLVDTDMDIDGAIESEISPYVIASKHHDVFADIIIAMPDLMAKVIAAHARSVVRSGGQAPDESVLHERALNLASKIGHLRLVDHQNGWNLKLHDFPFGVFKTVDPPVSEVVALAIGRSSQKPDIQSVISLVEQSIATCGDLRDRLIGDHDYFSALAKVLAQEGIRGSSSRSLFTSFLAAVHCVHLVPLAWHSQISDWASETGKSAFTCIA